MYVNGVELELLKREIENGYTPTTATILDLIEKARGFHDAKRYVYLRDAKLHDPVWAAWVEFNAKDDMDRIVDEHIQAAKINELTPNASHERAAEGGPLDAVVRRHGLED